MKILFVSWLITTLVLGAVISLRKMVAFVVQSIYDMLLRVRWFNSKIPES